MSGPRKLPETQVSADDRAVFRGNALINTRTKPAGYDQIKLQALQANAYHTLDPYPAFHFQDWKTEERGPYPRCMPLAKGIVRTGAKWLFGRKLTFTIKGNKKLQEIFNDAWKVNRMPTRMVAGAEKAALQGTMVLKFAYDAKQGLRFSLLSPIDNCRVFFDPIDQDKILMLRIQFPYYEAAENKWYFYREEWTDQQIVHYKPLEAIIRPLSLTSSYGTFSYGSSFVVSGGSDPDLTDRWQEEKRESNPFGLVPAVVIRNVESDSTWGVGDLWSYYRIFDRVNLAYHLMDRSNQFDSEPTPVYIDLMADRDDLDKPLAPGQGLSLKTDVLAEGAEGRQGKVDMLEPAGKLRPYITEYAKDLRKQIYDAVGHVELHQDEITNKGNLTQAVLAQLYGPLIIATDEKRKTYGDDGIVLFLEKVALGCKKAGIKDFASVDVDSLESYEVELNWPQYFHLTEQEKFVSLERLVMAEQSGYVDHELAVREYCDIEQVVDVEELVAKMKDWQPPVDPNAGPGAEGGIAKQKKNDARSLIDKKWRSMKEKVEASNLQVKEDGSAG